MKRRLLGLLALTPLFVAMAIWQPVRLIVLVGAFVVICGVVLVGLFGLTLWGINALIVGDE